MTTNTIEVTPDKVLEVMREAYRCDEPIYLEGPSGVGKTSLVQQLGEELGIPCKYPLILSSLEPPDLRGLPYVKDGVTYHARPEFLPAYEDSPSILFLDELPGAEPRLHAPCYQLVLERRIGPHKLPKGSWVVAAGNTIEDKTMVYELPGPLLKRMTMVRVRPDAKSWLSWAEQNNVHLAVRTVIKKQPELLDRSLMPDINQEDVIQPCPRSWVDVSKFLHKVSNPEVLDVLVPGKIGLYAYATYKTVIEELGKLKSPQEYIALAKAKKLREHLPDNGAMLYAMMDGLVGYYKEKRDVNRVMEVAKVLEVFLEESENSNLPYRETITVTLLNRRIRKREKPLCMREILCRILHMSQTFLIPIGHKHHLCPP